MEQTVLIVETQISRVEPAAGEGLGRGRLGIEVAEHQMWTAVGDFAHVPTVTGLSASSRMAVSTLTTGRPPAAPGMCILLVGSQRGGQGGSHFGLTVEVPQSEVG